VFVVVAVVVVVVLSPVAANWEGGGPLATEQPCSSAYSSRSPGHTVQREVLGDRHRTTYPRSPSRPPTTWKLSEQKPEQHQGASTASPRPLPVCAITSCVPKWPIWPIRLIPRCGWAGLSLVCSSETDQGLNSCHHRVVVEDMVLVLLRAASVLCWPTSERACILS
jgi:hypothetical protein